MKKIVDFLSELYQNNNREWFEQHKGQYKEVLNEFNVFAEKLIDGIAAFDPTVSGLSIKDCTYRIYRDTRFSHDKTPYKTHFGVYICRGGKKSGYAGYYFHVEPVGNNLIGGNLLSSGIYMPEPKVLKSIREDISFRGDELITAVKKAAHFQMDMSDTLQKVPQGFPKDSPYAQYLKLKNVHVMQSLSNDDILKEDLLPRILKEFKTSLDLIQFLNKAVTYAYEEL